MKIPTKMISSNLPRWLTLGFLLIPLAFGACTQREETQNRIYLDTSKQGTGSLGLPSAISLAVLPIQQLRAYLVVSDGGTLNNRVLMQINSNENVATVTVPDLTAGNTYLFKVEFDYISIDHAPLRLANSLSQSLTVNAGSNPLVFSDSGYAFPDEDLDSFSNLLELQKGGNPYDISLIPDVNAPTISDRFLKFSQPVINGITITWVTASDTIANSDIQYRLIYSTANNINSVADALANGTIYSDWMAGSTSVTVNLGGTYQRFWNVLAQDTQNNLASYQASFVHGVGIFDASFSMNGYVSSEDFAVNADAAGGNASVIDGNGKIVVAGFRYNSLNLNNDMAVWRLNTDGSLDTTFNGTGYFLHDNPAGGSANDIGTDLVIDANNRIVVSGYSQTATMSRMAVWRLNENGTPDPTFSVDGFYPFVSDYLLGATKAYGVAIGANNRIVVVGEVVQTTPNTNRDMVVWQLNGNDGSLDISFGIQGYATHHNAAGGAEHDYGSAVAIDSNNRILITGRSQVNSSFEYTQSV